MRDLIIQRILDAGVEEHDFYYGDKLRAMSDTALLNLLDDLAEDGWRI